MRLYRLFYRFFILFYIILYYRLDQLLFSITALRKFKFIIYLNPFYYFIKKNNNRGVRLRMACEKLGPVFIKFGQILSTRRDLLFPDMIDELEKLQDQVPPFSSDIAKNIIEEVLNKKMDQLFLSFDVKPLASASMAQVHRAVLLNSHSQQSQQVIIKILRPNIEKKIKIDLSLLKLFIFFLQKLCLKNAPRFRLIELVLEFERVILRELDLIEEAANAIAMYDNTIKNKNLSPYLLIPKVYWSLCRKEILVMDYIAAQPLNKLLKLKNNINNKNNKLLKLLSRNLITIFFTQVFEQNFFHGDLHPGNILIKKSYDLNQPGQFVFVDFGAIGSLTPFDQHYVAENLLAFFERDYQRVAELHLECGWLTDRNQAQEFATILRAVTQPFFGHSEQSHKNIQMGQLLKQLLQTAMRFHIEIQPQLLLLQKNLLHIESISSQLDPEINLWEIAQPFLKKWLRQQFGWFYFLEKFFNNFNKFYNYRKNYYNKK